jgi:hypothetical protein
VDAAALHHEAAQQLRQDPPVVAAVAPAVLVQVRDPGETTKKEKGLEKS